MKETKFKQTEIGEIPYSWELKTLTECGKFSKGKGIARKDSISGHLPAVRYGELYTSHLNYVRNFQSFISPEIAKQSKEIKYGDVLFACSGETKEEIGNAAAIVDNITAYAGGDIVVLSLEPEKNPAYIGFICNSPASVKQKAGYGQGDAVVHISTANLSRIKIPIPPPKEQKAIAEALTDVDGLIVGLDELIAKKKAILEGTMQELLSGKRRLPGFSEPWEIKNILADCTIKTGKIDANHAVDYGQFPFFTCDAIPKRIDEYAFDQEAVLISGNGSRLGHISYYNGKFNAYQRTYVIGPFDDEIITTYRVQILKFAFRDYIQTVCKASSIPFITLPVLNEYVYSVPSDKDEQKAIATVLSDMDAEIAELEAKREKYVAIRQGMMQQLLTGKIRLI